jgi:hypothetical protein
LEYAYNILKFNKLYNIGDKDLDGLKNNGNKEQFDRYTASLDYLIFTDYIIFWNFEVIFMIWNKNSSILVKNIH